MLLSRRDDWCDPRNARKTRRLYYVDGRHGNPYAFAVSFYANLAYKPDVDFEPIGTVFEIPFLIVARKDLPPRDLKELLLTQKRTPKS